jgi:hypothetical protein
MTFAPSSIKQYRNLFEVETEYNISSRTNAPNEKLSKQSFEKMKNLLNKSDQFLRDNLFRKQSARRQANLLKVTSFLIPLFMGLKKKMKIPDLNNLLPMVSSEECRTERELPPLIIGPEFKNKTFYKLSQENDNSPTLNNENNTKKEEISDKNQNKYFNLHGGIQFEIETCNVNKNTK